MAARYHSSAVGLVVRVPVLMRAVFENLDDVRQNYQKRALRFAT